MVLVVVVDVAANYIVDFVNDSFADTLVVEDYYTYLQQDIP